MKLKFTKMHGCGNDYIYFNCFDGQVIESPETLAPKLSDRHKGIGGDGIVLILPPDACPSGDSNIHAGMRMFNADGSEGRMCGNALRCVTKYVYDNGLAPGRHMRIWTQSGIKELEVIDEGGKAVAVKANLGPAELSPSKVPVLLPGEKIISVPVEVGGEVYEITCVLMNNGHAVVFVDDVSKVDLQRIGPLFENHPIFPDRINTEFIQVISRDRLKMRVWERGSGQTMACGTGACAAVVAAVLNGHCDAATDVTVELDGGELVANYTEETVIMTGDCNLVFEGTVEVY